MESNRSQLRAVMAIESKPKQAGNLSSQQKEKNNWNITRALTVTVSKQTTVIDARMAVNVVKRGRECAKNHIKPKLAMQFFTHSQAQTSKDEPPFYCLFTVSPPFSSRLNKVRILSIAGTSCNSRLSVDTPTRFCSHLATS